MTTNQRHHSSVGHQSLHLQSCIGDKTARIGVIGLGYVGLPLALRLAGAGFPVTGFDIDHQKIAWLMNGESYFHTIPNDDILSARRSGFRATDDFNDLSVMDVIIVCVPTPLDDHHQPDLSYIEATARAVAQYLRAGQLIVLESTTWPGTTEEVLVPMLEQNNDSALQASHHCSDPAHCFFVAFSPEREDPGNPCDRREIPKVVGGVDEVSTRLAAALYSGVVERVVPVSTAATAEMTKLLENIYRSVNIALVNELKLLCLRMGIDVWEVISAASTKPYGFQAFYPGPGLGGHCIPIDPFYLSWKAREFDFHTRFIELAGEINTAMPYHVVNAVAAALNRVSKPVNGSRVLVLGVAYKKNVDDLRESPALKIIQLLQERGACVSFHDPYVARIGKGRKYDLPMERVELRDLGQYDCLLIVTDHSAYDFADIVAHSRLVVDTRNATQGIASSRIVHC